MGEAKQILASAKTVDGLHVITGTRQGLDANALRLMGDFLRDKDPHVVGVLASIVGEKVTFLAVCGKEAVARGVKAGDLVRTVSAVCGGKGGGKPDSAMGGGTELLKVDDALAAVDDFVAEATPETKLALIKKLQAEGHLVAMNSGTQAAREAGNMVDLDSNPTKLIEIVEIGKQMLITRGALTTFSFANDVAKYFAIIPAMFAGLFVADGMARGPLSALNVMGLHSPQRAILSAVIFNALIIVALIPLALKGVSYRPAGAASLLKRNILIYGVGGLIAPFIGIKLIDMAVTALHLV